MCCVSWMISDKAVLLHQTGITWGPSAPWSRAGAVSALVTFDGSGDASERVFGASLVLAARCTVHEVVVEVPMQAGRGCMV